MLIFLFFDQFYLQIFFMLFKLFLYDPPISNQTSSSHIILILKSKKLFLQSIDLTLHFTLFLNNLMKLSAFLQSLKLFELLIIIINYLLIVRDLSHKDLLSRCLRFITIQFLSFFLLLLKIDIDYLLKLLQNA